MKICTLARQNRWPQNREASPIDFVNSWLIREYVVSEVRKQFKEKIILLWHCKRKFSDRWVCSFPKTKKINFMLRCFSEIGNFRIWPWLIVAFADPLCYIWCHYTFMYSAALPTWQYLPIKGKFTAIVK